MQKSLMPMSRSPPHHGLEDPQLLNSPKTEPPNFHSDNIPSSKEGRRARKRGGKRRLSSSRHRFGASKRRRLGTSSSKSSRKKEGPFHESRDGPALHLEVPAGGHDANADPSAKNNVLGSGTDNLNSRSRVDDEPKKYTTLFVEGAREPGIRTVASGHKAAHSDDAKLTDSPTAPPTSKVLSANPNNTDERVLRPRRQSGKTAQINRVLKEVALSAEDHTRIVGRRIKVYWPLDERWYFGSLLEYDAATKRHRVVYDDHDEEWLFLPKERFKIQVYPGDNFTILASNRSWSQIPAEQQQEEVGRSRLQIPVEQQQEEVAAIVSGEKIQSWNGLKDGNAIEDDTLLSALVPKHRLEEAFRKGSSNGSSKSAVSPLKIKTENSRISKQSPTLASLIDDECTLKALAAEVKQKSDAGAALVSKSVSFKGDKTFEREPVFVAEEHAPLDKALLGKAVGGGNISRINNHSRAVTVKSACVYVRRQSNRLKVRNSLADGAEAGGDSSLGRSDISSGASTAVGIQTAGVENQEEDSRKSSNAFQVQTVDTKVKLDNQQSIPPEGRTAQLESQSNWANGNAYVLGNLVCNSASLEREACRLVSKAGERKQHHVAGASRSSSGRMKPLSSLGLTYDDARLAIPDRIVSSNGNRNLGYNYRNGSFNASMHATGKTITSLTAKANGFSCQGQLELRQQHFGISRVKVKLNLFQQDPQEAFLSTIYLLHLDFVILDLFTRQFFDILKGVGLCDGDSLDERFSMNGSFLDLLGIVQLLLTIIKTFPPSVWTHQRWRGHWQGRILHKLQNVLSGRDGWFAALPSILPAKAEHLLVQHLRQFIPGGSSSSHMTFRQIFNILVYYFIKPYVITTLCESGASLTIIIQHFLLQEKGKSSGRGDIQCVTQSARSVRLRSCADAESGFSYYLEHFPIFNDWRAENGLFPNQMNKWIATTAGIGYMEQSTPVPCIKLFNHLGLLVSLFHASAKGSTTGTAGKVSYLKQSSGGLLDRLRPTGDARGGVVDGVFGFHLNGYTSPDLLSGRFLTSMLQICVEGEENYSPKVSSLTETSLNHVKSGLPLGGVKSKLFKHGKKVLARNNSRNIKDPNRKPSQRQCAGQMGIEAEWKFVGDCQTNGMIRGSKARELEADVRISVRTPFTTEYNASSGVKNEGLLRLKGLQKSDGYLSPKSTKKDIPYLQGADDDAHIASGPPSNLILDSTMGPVSTCQNGLESKPQINAEQYFGKMEKEPWVDPKMASYYSRLLDRRKRKREVPRSSDVSYLRARRLSKRGRPPQQSWQDMGADQISPNCCANLLITKGDRGWREPDVRVDLQTDANECLIAVQVNGGKIYTHKVQHITPTFKTNRHNRAIMWKGGNTWTLEFCDRKQWHLFKDMYEECAHRNARAASVKQIPIPGVRHIEGIDGVDSLSAPFSRSPFDYICQTEGEVEAALKGNCIMLDLDSEDEAWLAEINGTSLNSQHSISSAWITEENFERIMDKLEKVAYMRHGEVVPSDEAVEICQDLGSADAVRAIHTYWLQKRLAKGTALVRQFQPPLWEQYQKQVQNWQASFDELQLRLPSVSKEQLLEQCPRPPMFAFCLPPRGPDASNISKKMQKQRSQRSLFKSSRASSLSESSEELQRQPRLQRVHAHQRWVHSSTDPDWHPSSGLRVSIWPHDHQQLVNSPIDPKWHPSSRLRVPVSSGYRTTEQNYTSWDKSHEQIGSGLGHLNALDPFMKLEEAQKKAAAARERAGIKAAKSQRLFSKFDVAMQRAVAALMEFEAIQFAEQVVGEQDTGPYSPTVSDDQLPVLKEKVGLFSSQFLKLLGKEKDSNHTSKDGDDGSSIALGPFCCEDRNTICEVLKQTEECEEADPRPVLIGDADALLPIPGRDHLDAWMGTTLLQRPDKEEEMNIHIT